MSSGSARRRSLTLHGVSEEIEKALQSDDEKFYGLTINTEELTTSDSDSHGDSDPQPPKKKPYGASAAAAGSAPMTSGEASRYDRDEDSSVTDDGSDDSAAVPPPTSEQVKRGLLASDISDAIQRGCGCKKENHWKVVPNQQLEDYMFKVSQMKRKEKSLFVLGELTACLSKSKTGSGAQPYYFRYTVRGFEVCRVVFMEVHDVGSHVLKRLQTKAEKGEVQLSPHGLIGKVPHHLAISPDVEQSIVQFVHTYANLHGLPQPAAERGRAEDPPVYLPASKNKKKAYKTYADVQDSPLQYWTFCRVWKRHAPHIKVMKPRTDVCAICEKLRDKIRVARTEEDTDSRVKALQTHIALAQEERQYYRDLIDGARESIDNSDDDDDCTEGIAHYTFDYAQQLELPYHTRQVGPLYFKVRFRVQLFGIAEEARNKQVNFLFHEGQAIGQDGKKAHGPNAVVSMLDEFMTNHANDKRQVHFHADNCVGQNKNKSVLAYMAMASHVWLVRLH